MIDPTTSDFFPLHFSIRMMYYSVVGIIRVISRERKTTKNPSSAFLLFQLYITLYNTVQYKITPHKKEAAAGK